MNGGYGQISKIDILPVTASTIAQSPSLSHKKELLTRSTASKSSVVSNPF
ncbi:hypothetical protein HMPREF0542_12248 [Ligilactobacillus ruminis ATCC 25644]|uniref:Uncharacterized protein n=1 Tax=Ligilactobacillus ruminis ATCC 25644 TaxID=525362 RepID=E7FTM0_9LACO|nr:hypothetical protein HMPREF0542_12248 [Ligilactobacillus ruminis ATCC 25644]EGX98666.1 hypothetical protein ANHS_769 [Ligilactobacillus ruminis ATCC 25644]